MITTEQLHTLCDVRWQLMKDAREEFDHGNSGDAQKIVDAANGMEIVIDNVIALHLVLPPKDR